VDNNLTVGGNFTNSGNLITGGNLTIGGDLEVNDIEVNIIKIGDSFITSNDDLDVVSQTIDYPTYSPYDSIPTQSLIITNVPSYEPLSKINVGYFPDYTYGDIDIKTIPAQKLTHIIVGFMWAQPSQTDYDNAVTAGWTYSGFYDNTYTEGILTYRNKTDTESIIGELKGLREKHPHLKVNVSLGGGSLSWNISKVVGDATLRDNLVKSIGAFLVKNDLDGIDLDWEYPRLQNHAWDFYDATNDIPNLILFLSELRILLNNVSPNKYLQITMATGNYESLISKYVGVEPYIDYIFLMTYDYAGHTYNGTNPHTSLDSFISGSDRYAKKSVEFANTLDNFPLNKICIGSASYGYGWESVTPPATGTDYFGTSNSGEAYNFSTGDKDGVESYINIVSKIASDPTYVVTYGNDNNTMVYIEKSIGGGDYEIWTYENEVTAGHKGDYIIEAGLAGIVNWEITKDTLTNESTSIIHSLYSKFLKLELSSLSLNTNSVERVRISNTGNVGINTNNPSKTLDVNGDINFTGGLTLNGADYGLTYWVNDNNDIYNSNSGNVGIGTTAPITLLHIEGPDTATPPIVFISNTSEDWGGLRLGDSSAPTTQNFDLVYNNSTEIFKIRSDDTDNCIVVKTDGNVGIGITSPTTDFSVSGVSSFLNGNVGIGTDTPTTLLHIEGPDTATPPLVFISNTSEDWGGIRFGDSSAPTTQNFDLLYNSSTQDFKIRSDDVDNIMYLNYDDGNVGFGITSPTEKMEVNGNIKCDSIIPINTGQFVNKYVSTGTTFVNDTSSSSIPIIALSHTYTPLSSTSKLLITFDANYSVSGSGTSDVFWAAIYVGTTVIYKKSEEMGRGGVLFPIQGVYTNTGTSALTITVKTWEDNSDDSITFSLFNTTTIEEIEN
jgi:GH18 family chitinase